MASVAISDSTLHVVAPRSLPRPSTAQVLVGLVAVLSALGAALSFSSFSSGPEQITDEVGEIGISKPTSFGVVAVEYAERLSGLTPGALSGASHGIQNLVVEDQAQIQLAISLTNQTSGTLKYSPAHFRLRVGDGSQRIDTQSSTFGEGVLQPHTNIEGRIGFVAPRDGRQLTLEYADVNGAPVTVLLGTTDSMPGKTTSHGHGSSSTSVDASKFMPPATGAGVTLDTSSQETLAPLPTEQK